MAGDRYRFFRIEAQELLEGLSQGVLDAEQGGDAELLKRLLRQAHTFKGAARVVRRPDIGDLAHQIEDLLSPFRDATAPVDRATVDKTLKLLDRIRTLVGALDSETQASPHLESEDKGAEHQTLRVTLGDLDRLSTAAFEARNMAASVLDRGNALGAVCSQVRGLQLARDMPTLPHDAVVESTDAVGQLEQLHREIVEGTEQVLAELRELSIALSDLRLVSAHTLATDLKSAARDAASTLGKNVDVVITGADTLLDTHVLTHLRKALLHVVRNSVAHGVEDVAERKRLGKPVTARIEVDIQRVGHNVRIRCRDDGRGMDLERIRRAAVAQGIISEPDARIMSESALFELLLRGGLSTSAALTEISGRGVGLEAVRHAVDVLQGELSIESSAGRGAAVHLLVPQSLTALPALALGVEDRTFLVPVDSVRAAVRVSANDIVRDARGGHIVLDGEVIPFAPLGRALGSQVAQEPSVQSAIVLEAEGRRAAVGVDALGAVQRIVVHGVPKHAAVDEVVAGATFNDQGLPELVLAPRAVIRAVGNAASEQDVAVNSERPPLLVIDDSLTTRMLEQSILESAGYQVDLATSGEEGLERASRKRYGVFIVDVEMPGMSGFEFIARVRDTPELRDTPAILVTSRADPSDKRRGKDVGARAYIVKSEFDQAYLLRTIRSLVG